MLSSQEPKDGRTRTVFISSPFEEPKGKEWRIRRQLHDLLDRPPYKPWLYNIEGEREERATRKSPDVIIREAIAQSDVVVCFFKHRLGSWMRTRFTSGPFHGTDDEIVIARQLDKPILLYKISDEPEPLLRSFWELFEDSRILPHAVRKLANDEELLHFAPSDLDECWSAASPLYLPALALSDADGLWPEVPDILTLERLRDHLLFVRSQDDLCAAEKIAAAVPLVEESRLSRPVKLSYAALLADCGNTWANRTQFDRAIRAVHLAIRYYMEAGDSQNMFSQVLCLSGILNMANLRRAQYVHRYGSESVFHTVSLQPLLASCHDNKASILMTAGDWSGAHAEMENVLRHLHDASPYTLSKYAISMAISRADKLDEANDTLFEEALPLARQRNRDLGYTLKWAAILALRQDQRVRARALIDEGVAECMRIGNRHTLADIRAAESYYQLTEAW